MHGLSKEVNLTFLKAKQLELICFAAYSIYLHFDDKIIITIEGAFQHSIQGNKTQSLKCTFPLVGSNLMRLLTQKVKEVRNQSDGTLELDFSNGDVLIIYGDNGPYEAYHIKHGEHVITV